MSPYTPSVHVEFAFGYGPMQETTDGSFVEPAAVYPTTVIVDEVTIARGRPSEFDTFPPGTCQINIWDRDRVLDPQNTAGPYYGLLKPRVPVRVRGKIGSTFYPRFYGYVDGWPMQVGRQESVVNIVATDGFKVLQGIALPQSLYEAEVLDDSPTAYWKLGEATGTLAADYSGNRHDGVYLDAGLRGQPSVVPYGGDGSLDTTGRTTEMSVEDSYVGMVVTDEGAKVGDDTAGDMSVECWIAAGTDSASFSMRQDIVGQGYGGTYAFGWQLMLFPGTYNVLLPAGPLNSLVDKLVFANSNFDIYSGWLTPNICNGQPHHIVVTLEVAGGVITGGPTLYLDGELVVPLVDAETGSTSVRPDNDIVIGTGAYVAENVAFRGRIDEVALYGTALSAADVLSHYTAGASLGEGEVTGARITRILDLINWPAAARSIDNGEHILGPAVIAGRTAFDYLQAVAASEQGRLFMSRDGKLTFHARDRFITEATESTSQFVFSDDGAGDAIYGAAQFTYDERFLYNQAVITREGGSPVTIDNTSSQADYGPLTRTLNGLLLRDEGQARSIGEYLVYRYNQPQVRAETFELQPEVDAASFADVFGLEIGHRVTVENKPSNKGTQFALDLHLEQVTEQIVPQAWAIAYRGSPADPNAGSYFTWGKSSGAGTGWGPSGDLWR